MAYEGNLKNIKLNVKKYIMQINKISDHFEIIKHKNSYWVEKGYIYMLTLEIWNATILLQINLDNFY